MHEIQSTGILLRSRDHAEDDLILTFWTQQFGKLSLRASKARKSKKRFEGAQHTFSTHLLTFQRHREDTWPVLLRLEPQSLHLGLHDDLRAFSAASYIGELYLRLTEDNDPQPELYDLLASVVSFCLEKPLSPKLLLRFQLRFLEVLGLQPDWFSCMECAAPLTPASWPWRFDLAQGGLLCKTCLAPNPHAAPRLSVALRDRLAALQERHKTDDDDEAWKEALTLLDLRFEHLLGQPSKSRAFFREIAGF